MRLPPVLTLLNRIFHYKPSSYWGTPIFRGSRNQSSRTARMDGRPFTTLMWSPAFSVVATQKKTPWTWGEKVCCLQFSDIPLPSWNGYFWLRYLQKFLSSTNMAWEWPFSSTRISRVDDLLEKWRKFQPGLPVNLEPFSAVLCSPHKSLSAGHFVLEN